MTDPKVSVIMGVYNCEQFVGEAVESILGQTLDDFEFIIVDDDSSDATLPILESFDDARLRVIRQQPRRGLTQALLTSADASRGAFIARQDADDVSEAGRLAAQARYLEQHPDILLVGTFASVIDGDGRQIGQTCKETAPNLLTGDLRKENQFIHGSIMMRREAYFKVGGYRPGFLYAQDYDLVLRMAEIGRIANLPMKHYRHRMRAEMISMREHERQQWYRDLARFFHGQRTVNGTDQLQDGKPVPEPEGLNDRGEGCKANGEQRYQALYIYSCLRYGNVSQARAALRKAIASEPNQVRYYINFLSTLLGSAATRHLYRMWDQWRREP